MPEPDPIAELLDRADLSAAVEAIVRAFAEPITSAGEESLRDTVRALADAFADHVAPVRASLAAWADELAASSPERLGHIASSERRQFAYELRRRLDLQVGGEDG